MSLILKAIQQTAWAITPDYLELMTAISGRDYEQLKALGYGEGKQVSGTRKPVEIFGSVAVVPVHGAMFRRANMFTELCGATSTECLINDLIALADRTEVGSLVLDFDTPGGDAAPMSEAAEYINLIQETTGKPIYAYVGDKACSAGYWLASQCKEIIVSKTGMLGSIGAVLTYRKTNDSDESVGEIVSSRAPNKRKGPNDPEGRDLLQTMIDDMQDVFIEGAATGRGMSQDELVEAGNHGGVVLGAKAVEAGLADRVGNLKTLIDELNQTQPKPTPKKPKGGHSMAYNTLAEMQADNPELCEELKAQVIDSEGPEIEKQALEAGAKKERERVKSLLDFDVLGHEETRRAAIDSGESESALAMKVLQAESGQRKEFLAGAKDDEANELDANATIEPKGGKSKKLTPKEIKQRANDHVNAEAAEGRTVSYDQAVALVANGEI